MQFSEQGSDVPATGKAPVAGTRRQSLSQQSHVKLILLIAVSATVRWHSGAMLIQEKCEGVWTVLQARSRALTDGH